MNEFIEVENTEREPILLAVSAIKIVGKRRTGGSWVTLFNSTSDLHLYTAYESVFQRLRAAREAGKASKCDCDLLEQPGSAPPCNEFRATPNNPAFCVICQHVEECHA